MRNEKDAVDWRRPGVVNSTRYSELNRGHADVHGLQLFTKGNAITRNQRELIRRKRVRERLQVCDWTDLGRYKGTAASRTKGSGYLPKDHGNAFALRLTPVRNRADSIRDQRKSIRRGCCRDCEPGPHHPDRADRIVKEDVKPSLGPKVSGGRLSHSFHFFFRRIVHCN